MTKARERRSLREDGRMCICVCVYVYMRARLIEEGRVVAAKMTIKKRVDSKAEAAGPQK